MKNKRKHNSKYSNVVHTCIGILWEIESKNENI